jgi:hypothetical protein
VRLVHRVLPLPVKKMRMKKKSTREKFEQNLKVQNQNQPYNEQ